MGKPLTFIDGKRCRTKLWGTQDHPRDKIRGGSCLTNGQMGAMVWTTDFDAKHPGSAHHIDAALRADNSVPDCTNTRTEEAGFHPENSGEIGVCIPSVGYSFRYESNHWTAWVKAASLAIFCRRWLESQRTAKPCSTSERRLIWYGMSSLAKISSDSWRFSVVKTKSLTKGRLESAISPKCQQSFRTYQRR